MAIPQAMLRTILQHEKLFLSNNNDDLFALGGLESWNGFSLVINDRLGRDVTFANLSILVPISKLRVRHDATVSLVMPHGDLPSLASLVVTALVLTVDVS